MIQTEQADKGQYLKNFRKVVELRNDIIDLMFDCELEKISPNEKSKKFNELNQQYLEIGRKYYNNENLTRQDLNCLVIKEMNKICGIGLVEFEELENIRDSVDFFKNITITDHLDSFATEELGEIQWQNAYLQKGRIYFKMPNLGFAELEELYKQELIERKEKRFLDLIQLRENAMVPEFLDYRCISLNKNNYLIFGRKYYKNPDLTLEELEALYNQELQEKNGESKKLTGE